MYYELHAIDDSHEMIYKANDIREIVFHLRNCCDENFRKIQIIDSLGVIHYFHEDPHEEKDVYISPEINKIWINSLKVRN